MTSEFVPFDLDNDEITAWQVLRDGIPVSMAQALLGWMARQLSGDDYMNAQVLHDIENHCDLRIEIVTTPNGFVRRSDAVAAIQRLGVQSVLRIVDYQVSKAIGQGARDDLEKVLRVGRSKYCVTKRPDRWGLGFRVPEGTQLAAEHLISEDSAAGRLLAHAWGYAYGLEPDDSAAYAFAVKAVEAAAFPVLKITDELATLSTATRAIEKRDATWRLPFTREHGEYPSRDVLLGMMKSLYRGQHDRHGSEDYAGVGHDEAVAAVLLAVSLVGLFAGGLVSERDPDQYV